MHILAIRGMLQSRLNSGGPFGGCGEEATIPAEMPSKHGVERGTRKLHTGRTGPGFKPRTSGLQDR